MNQEEQKPDFTSFDDQRPGPESVDPDPKPEKLVVKKKPRAGVYIKGPVAEEIKEVARALQLTPTAVGEMVAKEIEGRVKDIAWSELQEKLGE